jgi:hypothetical protein
VEWAKRVERWKDSGLTAKEFAAETGVKASTLTYWSWRLRASRPKQPSARSSAPRGRFVQLSASSPSAAPATLELVLGAGIVVRIPSGFDEETLTRVVRAVGAAR